MNQREDELAGLAAGIAKADARIYETEQAVSFLPRSNLFV